MKKILSALAVFAVLCSALMYPALADDNIKEIETEIVNDFIPDHLQTDTQRNITREEFCATLVGLYEYISKTPAELPREHPFTDTDSTDVLKAYQMGIVQGIGNGLFMPDQELNVEQKAVMLYNTLKLLDPSIDSEGSHLDFNDAESISTWAVEAIEYLYHHAVINDDEGENINPADPVTVDSANSHAQIALDHYNDLTELTDSDETQLLGCSAKDTRVTMYDGTFKLISEIKPGDKLLGEDGMMLSVTDVITGNEESVIAIKYADGGYIAVSQSQPLATENGVIRAHDLRPGDKLLGNDGNTAEIKFIYYSAYNDAVYQLVFENESSNLYVANGIFVGDVRMQNEMQPYRR